MHACTPADVQSFSVLDVGHTMADWSMMDREWLPDGSYNPYSYGTNDYYHQEYQEKPPPPLSECYPAPHAQQYYSMQQPPPPPPAGTGAEARTGAGTGAGAPTSSQPPPPVFPDYAVVPRGDNARETRNKAEKQRRDKLNHSISELAAMVPPVVAANKKIDKTGVLRLTAHYLRAHQYVFGDSIGRSGEDFSAESSELVLSLLGGFLLTTTYRGLVVVVSQNVQKYLGHKELDLLGKNIFNYVHPDDHTILKEKLMPDLHLLGPNGELLIPNEPDGKKHIAEALAKDKRRFLIRFQKHVQRSEPVTYVPCYVEGTLRQADRARRVPERGCQVVRRARARTDNPFSSGNDVVFVGLVRPSPETFISEKRLESYRMEYRTRHSVDGEIVECEHRISMVAGYMTHEVNGVNAMNFIHRDDVRWVIFSLREMYDQHRLEGESCYRLMTKSGQFIYMRTRGVLDVDQESKAVRSFVCTNTMVDEEQGKHLIRLMKKRCLNLINYYKIPSPAIAELKNAEVAETESKDAEDETLPVHDLERVILNLVTNLPSPQPSYSPGNSPEHVDAPGSPLAIIPPQRERILSAIEKFNTVIKTVDKREQSNVIVTKNDYDGESCQAPHALSPAQSSLMEQNLRDIQWRKQSESLPILSYNPGLLQNRDERSGFADDIAPFIVPQIPTRVSVMTVAEENDVQTGNDTLQKILLYSENVNPIQEFGLNATPQSNQSSRKRGQSDEQSNVFKKKNDGLEQAPSTSSQCEVLQENTPLTIIPHDMMTLFDFDLNTLDAVDDETEVQNIEDLEPSLWNFKRPNQ